MNHPENYHSCVFEIKSDRKTFCDEKQIHLKYMLEKTVVNSLTLCFLGNFS